MKLLLIAALIALAAAKPQLPEPIPILRSAALLSDDGSYSYNFESADGTKVAEAGSQKELPSEDGPVKGTVARGSYSYVHEGITYKVDWVADENGFQPTGAHLPVA